jgi:hypothetical protein
MTNEAEIYRLMYRTNFGAFAEAAFGELHSNAQLDRNWHINVLADRLATFSLGGTTRLMINLPPRSLKSFMTSIAMPAFTLGRDPRFKILILAGTPDLAADLRTNITRLMRSDRYRSIFGGIEWTEENRTLRFAQGGSLSVLKYGEAIIGKGYDIIIIDDPQSPSQVEDEAHRKEVLSYFQSGVLPRLNNMGSGRVALVQQRLHAEDLSGSVSSTGWDRLVISAISREDERWETQGGAITRAKGGALCEARESKEQLKETLLHMDPMQFSAQYLQSPYPPDDSDCKAFWVWELPGENYDPERDILPCGVVKVHIRDMILERYFNGPPIPYSYVNPNPTSIDWWERTTIRHQAELVKSAQGNQVGCCFQEG